MKTIIQKIDSGLAYFENGLIILILGVMVLLAFLQVLLRNLFDTGLLWGDIFLRQLVLWVGFIGASLATREEKHINIDVLTRLIPARFVPWAKIGVDLVSVIICVLLAKAGYVFLQGEIEFKTILFGNIPAWYFEIIIPIGFALIGFRFLLKVVDRTANLLAKNE